MKAKLLRDDMEYSGPEEECRDDTHEVEVIKNHSPTKIRCWKKGAVVNHPMSYRLVRQGICEPADEECQIKANMTPARMESAQHAYERLERGIHPTDFDRYDRGEMVGYNPDGSDIPGPNAATFDDVDDDTEDEEEDEEDEE